MVNYLANLLERQRQRELFLNPHKSAEARAQFWLVMFFLSNAGWFAFFVSLTVNVYRNG